MENLVTIVEVGAYSERQYQKQDGNHGNIDLWSMKSAEEGQVIAQPVPKALSVISVNFCVTKKEN